jgi:hypothetical protein
MPDPFDQQHIAATATSRLAMTDTPSTLAHGARP